MARKHHSEAQAVYYFTGETGSGIPGLPHEVSMAQADALGLLDQLQAAIENGTYTSQEPPASGDDQEEEGA